MSLSSSQETNNSSKALTNERSIWICAVFRKLIAIVAQKQVFIGLLNQIKPQLLTGEKDTLKF